MLRFEQFFGFSIGETCCCFESSRDLQGQACPMLSASDPYYVAKEDVAKAMDRLRGTGVTNWRDLSKDTARLQP